MKKQTHFFSRLPIYRQFLIISSVSMIMMLILSTLLILSTRQIFITNATSYAHIFTERFRNELDVVCLQLDVISSQIQRDTVYQELLSAKNYRQLNSQLIGEIDNKVVSIKSLYDSISDVALSNELIHQSTLFSEEDLNHMYRETVLDDMVSSHGLGLMKSSFLPLADNTYYVYRSNIYRNGKPIGCVFLSININQIHTAFSESDSPASYFIMDSNGNLYAVSPDTKNYQDTILSVCQKSGLATNAADPKKLPMDYNIQQNSFSIQMSYSQTAGCYIISAVHIPSISDILNGFWLYISIILMAIAFFTIVLFIVLYRNMIRPLNQFHGIIDKMRSSGQRHLEAPLSIEGCAEVRNLASTFSIMFSTIDGLNMQIFETTSKLYEEKIRGQATEISYYQSQINPHFLYNVLSLIRSLALSRNVPEIASISIAMGKMYRYNAKGTPIVPFKEELEMTKAYIEIQQYRFQNKFDVFYNIPEEVLDIPVIKIILQPLVENAIQHGIEPSLEPCMLYIGCSTTENEFLIEIRDDGVGISPRRLQEIQKLLQEEHYDTTNYVGIANTNARLRLQYGTGYGISITSQENDGTTVVIHMPLPEKTPNQTFNNDFFRKIIK